MQRNGAARTGGDRAARRLPLRRLRRRPARAASGSAAGGRTGHARGVAELTRSAARLTGQVVEAVCFHRPAHDRVQRAADTPSCRRRCRPSQAGRRVPCGRPACAPGRRARSRNGPAPRLSTGRRDASRGPPERARLQRAVRGGAQHVDGAVGVFRLRQQLRLHASRVCGEAGEVDDLALAVAALHRRVQSVTDERSNVPLEEGVNHAGAGQPLPVRAYDRASGAG